MTASDLDLLETRLRALVPEAPKGCGVFALVDAIEARLKIESRLEMCDCIWSRDGVAWHDCPVCNGMGCVVKHES